MKNKDRQRISPRKRFRPFRLLKFKVGRFTLISLVFLTLICCSGFSLYPHRKQIKKGLVCVVNDPTVVLKRARQHWREPETISKYFKPPISCGCTKHHLKFNKDAYKLHRKSAEKLAGGKLIQGDEDLYNDESLVQIQNGPGYQIDQHKLKFSSPYLQKEAYSVLKAIGLAYSQKVDGTSAEGSSFKISSVTRTHEQQKELRKQNKNATRGISAHSYGAAFDLYTIETKLGCSVAQKALESILIDFQRSGKVLLCPEGGCIHVTVKSV